MKTLLRAALVFLLAFSTSATLGQTGVTTLDDPCHGCLVG